MVLSIYNGRVAEAKKDYKYLRTIVLVKAEDLLELACFELETQEFVPGNYKWHWNKRNNLEGFDIEMGMHKFTWQPHGSQFTIIENIPQERLAIRIRQPQRISHEQVLSTLGFDENWFEIIKETPEELKLDHD
jgi:hypothetical protein